MIDIKGSEQAQPQHPQHLRTVQGHSLLLCSLECMVQNCPMYCARPRLCYVCRYYIVLSWSYRYTLVARIKHCVRKLQLLTLSVIPVVAAPAGTHLPLRRCYRPNERLKSSVLSRRLKAISDGDVMTSDGRPFKFQTRAAETHTFTLHADSCIRVRDINVVAFKFQWVSWHDVLMHTKFDVEDHRLTSQAIFLLTREVHE